MGEYFRHQLNALDQDLSTLVDMKKRIQLV